MFIHKQLGAEDRQHATVSTDSRTTRRRSDPASSDDELVDN